MLGSAGTVCGSGFVPFAPFDGAVCAVRQPGINMQITNITARCQHIFLIGIVIVCSKLSNCNARVLIRC